MKLPKMWLFITLIMSGFFFFAWNYFSLSLHCWYIAKQHEKWKLFLEELEALEAVDYSMPYDHEL